MQPVALSVMTDIRFPPAAMVVIDDPSERVIGVVKTGE
jgi:hypothetical protein